MESLTVQQIIKKLNNQEISIIDIPSEFRHHKKVLEEERKLGLRIEHNRGFDVVHNCFFVEEEIHYTNRLGELSKKSNNLTFESFEEYYNYLDGDIYENACYKYWHFENQKKFIKEKKIDTNRLFQKNTFLSETIDNSMSEGVLIEPQMINPNPLRMQYNYERCFKHSSLESVSYLVDIYGNSCSVIKKYQDGNFVVIKEWTSKEDGTKKNFTLITPYFFDFVYYLNGDLSNAFLVFCDGLNNINDLSSIDLSKAQLTSKLREKLGYNYERINYAESDIYSLTISETFEEKTFSDKTTENVSISANINTNHSLSIIDELDRSTQRISYITDIHLMHRILNADCKSQEDIIYLIKSIIDSISQEASDVLLIGGDTACCYSIFKLFIEMLNYHLNKDVKVVFILGNHELWLFNDKSIEEIATFYDALVKENGMYLLQNELLYNDNNNSLHKITYNELLMTPSSELRCKLQSASLVILGGIGFSGYNNKFNANKGIYRHALNRNTEINETKKFEELYKKILSVAHDKNTIVFTHMPKIDWCSDSYPDKNILYVNGHTHRNEFYDDGVYRIYSDNQIGYNNENIHLKSFLINKEYDIFSDYKDGIYEITGEQYNDFYRGKNIQMTFNRPINTLYMLKKNGYYCFINETKTCSLSILNGGALKRLDKTDVSYYFDHMDEVISYIEKPLEKYTNAQKKISDEIRKLGGTGTIHGCIIDIDFNNHVYLNPIDSKITGYYATDIINKYIYPSIPMLLKERCPDLYTKYLEQKDSNLNNPLTPTMKKNLELEIAPTIYLNTDIYKASREIKKMQKLKNNILSVWYDNPNTNKSVLHKSELLK